MLVKQRPYINILMVVVLAVAAIVLMSVRSSAQSNADTANSLKVTPVRSDITANPGETKTVKVTVTNPTGSEVMVRPVQNDFIAGDERGTPALILEEDEFAPNHSLKRFMKPLENVTVPANESKTVNVVVAVPATAEPGGYFGALRFAPVAAADGGQVNLNTSVASLILLRVNGEVPEKLDMTDFEIQKNGAEGAFFTDAEGLEAYVRFVNEGGVQLGPLGKISVMRGDTVVYEEDFNNKDQRDTILPDSARRFNIPLNDVDSFGKYTVMATFTYGSKNQTIEVTKAFWMVPVPFIIGAAVGLVVLLALIVALVMYLRKRSRGMSLGGRRR